MAAFRERSKNVVIGGNDKNLNQCLELTQDSAQCKAVTVCSSDRSITLPPRNHSSLRQSGRGLEGCQSINTSSAGRRCELLAENQLHIFQAASFLACLEEGTICATIQSCSMTKSLGLRLAGFFRRQLIQQPSC